MAAAVKPPPPGEQARTRLARSAVIEAARAMFVERGYPATTVEAISGRADVPAATVYRLFASKLGILKAVLDVSIAGDDGSPPLAARPAVTGLLADPDPVEVLTALVRLVVAINRRTNDVYTVLASAAVSDPSAAGLFGEYQAQRARGQARVTRRLVRIGGLRPGLREREAADIIHALLSPELYRLLVVGRAWTPARYERWLIQTLTTQLLETGPAVVQVDSGR